VVGGIANARRRQHPARIGLQNKLQQSGNLTRLEPSDANIISGEVKIAHQVGLTWPGRPRQAAGAPQIPVDPSSGSLASPYADIIAAKAPHPNAAKLWQELIYSDRCAASSSSVDTPTPSIQRP